MPQTQQFITGSQKNPCSIIVVILLTGAVISDLCHTPFIDHFSSRAPRCFKRALCFIAVVCFCGNNWFPYACLSYARQTKDVSAPQRVFQLLHCIISCASIWLRRDAFIDKQPVFSQGSNIHFANIRSPVHSKTRVRPPCPAATVEMMNWR